MGSSSGIDKKLQNAAVFTQEREPQMSQQHFHSVPKGLVNKVEVFWRCLMELDDDITSFSSKFSSLSKIQPESTKVEAFKHKSCVYN